MKKLFAILLGALLLTAVSCQGTEDTPPPDVPDAMVELTDWQSYTIVRPDETDSGTLDAASKLKSAIEDAAGVTLTLGTDWVKRGESVPVGTKEILIGETNRPESAAGLAYYDYAVGYTDGRVYISGGSGEALAQAVDWFIENCVSADGIQIPSDGYAYYADYPLADVTLGGIPLSAYTVMNNPTCQDLVDDLRGRLALMTGSVPSDTSGGRIVLTHDDTLGVLEYAITQEDSVLTIAAAELELEAVVDIFIDCLETRQSDDITINERKEFEMEQIQTITQAQLDEWRAETDGRIAEILASPNMVIPEDAVIYYVSNSGDDTNTGRSPEQAWATLEKVSGTSIPSGSYVCFERGGLWRGQLIAQPGVTYTAYGEGDKPKLYASPMNGGDASLWQKTDVENIWVFDSGWTTDVGTLVFNDGEAHAIKCVIRTEAGGTTFNNTTGDPFSSYADLNADLHFWHDYLNDGKIYLYSEQNPGERFSSIEFNIGKHVIFVSDKKNVTVDNLCIKYGGAHGVSGGGNVDGLTVQNCEMGWIGGSIQGEGLFGRNYGTRYGNAVEIYGGCNYFSVTDNYIYQVYDAAITQQVDLQNKMSVVKYQKNVTYARNVIEYCNYSIEYFLHGCLPENPSHIENFLIEDNDMWYAGYGFCEQRPDGGATHIKGWSGINRNRATGFVIRYNRIVETNGAMVQIQSDLYNPDGSDSMPTLEGNIFAGRTGDSFGLLGMNDVKSQAYTAPSIVDYVSEYSNGDVFGFIEE
ncbi:MAG: hypothetical protein IJ493_12780 [Clostridia bacterium]|nr:hypothetical protein [Clostridia bacterium]